MGVKMTRIHLWRFKKLSRDGDDIIDNNDNNSRDDKDGEKYRDKEEDRHQHPHPWQWKFAASSSSSSSWLSSLSWSKWRLKKKKRMLRPISLFLPLRFSFSLDDIIFRILYVTEAIVLVATFCLYFCCCGCHV